MRTCIMFAVGNAVLVYVATTFMEMFGLYLLERFCHANESCGAQVTSTQRQ